MRFDIPVPEIDVADLAQKLHSNQAIVLLDVREPWELKCAAIKDSRLVTLPMSQLAHESVDAFLENIRNRDAEILVLCHHGIRSANVTRWLRGLGWTKVFSVRGGIDEYAHRVDASVGRY